MKSVFLIFAFIIIAGAMSQPDKSVAEFSSLEVSVPDTFSQNNLSHSTAINMSSLTEQRSYRVQFEGLASQFPEVYDKLVDYRFSFDNCKLTKQPNFSLNCLVAAGVQGSSKKEGSRLSSFRVNPAFLLGKDKDPFYVIDIVFVDKDGNDIGRKYFTTSEGLHLSEENSGLKVTQK